MWSCGSSAIRRRDGRSWVVRGSAFPSYHWRFRCHLLSVGQIWWGTLPVFLSPSGWCIPLPRWMWVGLRFPVLLEGYEGGGLVSEFTLSPLLVGGWGFYCQYLVFSQYFPLNILMLCLCGCCGDGRISLHLSLWVEYRRRWCGCRSDYCRGQSLYTINDLRWLVILETCHVFDAKALISNFWLVCLLL